MSRFAFIAPPFPGHFNPMQALAGALIDRGHETIFVQQPGAERFLHRRSVKFMPVGLGSHPPEHLEAAIGRINAMTGLRNMSAVLRDLAETTIMLCREAPAVLRDARIDAVIADQAEAAGGLIARHIGLPYVSVANALPINEEPGVPPPFTGWGYDPSTWGIRRNKGGYAVSRLLMRPLRAAIERQAAEWRLGALRDFQDCLSPLGEISQMVPGFDFPRQALPQHFHYVGPLRDPDDREMRLPGTSRPLVFVSLGTLQGNRPKLFRIIAEACARLDLACVIAHGGRLSDTEAATLPVLLVTDFLPQREILRQAALVISHGGMNTVLDALSFGVPVVAIPLVFEQSAIGARLAYSGAGLSLKAAGLDATKLAEGVARVLSVSSYRSRAVALAREIAEAGGAARAAMIVEALMARRPPAAATMECPGAGDARGDSRNGSR